MNFYYDPILGLQYTNLGGLLIFDIENIPQGLDIKTFMSKWKSFSNELGTIMVDAEIVFKITNYNL